MNFEDVIKLLPGSKLSLKDTDAEFEVVAVDASDPNLPLFAKVIKTDKPVMVSGYDEYGPITTIEPGDSGAAWIAMNMDYLLTTCECTEEELERDAEGFHIATIENMELVECEG